MDNDVYLSIEAVSPKAINKVLAAHVAWMKRNKIAVTGKPKEDDINFSGPNGDAVFPDKDNNEDT